MAAAGGVYSRDPVKVVIINTQYVETDATSFKSVVQRLTGKDSKIEIHPSNSSPSSSSRYYSSSINTSSSSPSFYNNKDDHHHHYHQQPASGIIANAAAAAAANVPMMGRGLSFKDFDKLLKELPPLDELFRLCAD